MAKSNSRDDFSASVKRLLAQRAGYTCSYPGCNKITIFASNADENKAINNGVASHITAASPGGPRYDPSITDEERASASNGIWMCSEHSILIDRDDSSYSVQELREWKKNHEEDVKNRAITGMTLNDRLKKITIIDFGKLKGKHTFEVYKNTIFYSPDSIGKSMIFDLMSSLFGLPQDKRWYKKFNQQTSISKFLFSIDSKDLEYTFKVLETNKIQYELDGQQTFTPKPKFNMIYLAMEDKFTGDFDIDMKSAFNITKDIFKSLVDYINNNEKYFIKGIQIKNKKIEVLFKDDYITYGMLSTSEKERLFLEIAIQLAKKSSFEIGTILVLDKSSFWTLDDENYQIMLDKLTIADNKFQIVLITNEINPRIDYKDFILVEVK